MNPPLRILYAEDNPMDIDLTRAHFAKAAPEDTLETVTTGAECLARLAAQPFDLLLLDNHLPDMDGMDVLAALLAQGRVLPVVMVTGVGDEVLVARALRAGSCDYVPKRGDYLGPLPALVRAIVLRHRQQQQMGMTITSTPRRVLYVEPADVDRELTATHFAEHAPHLSLIAVTSPGEAFERLEARDGCDLVLADLRMPGMSGLEFLHEAKHRGLDLPFIIITGRGDEEAAVAALRLGAYDYLVKRDNYLTQLPYAIDNAIHRYRLDQMTQRLHRELVDINATLEKKVCERTAELKAAEIELREQLQELQQWQRVTLGREGRMLELKREVNELLRELGRPSRYASQGASG